MKSTIKTIEVFDTYDSELCDRNLYFQVVTPRQKIMICNTTLLTNFRKKYTLELIRKIHFGSENIDRFLFITKSTINLTDWIRTSKIKVIDTFHIPVLWLFYDYNITDGYIFSDAWAQELYDSVKELET